MENQSESVSVDLMAFLNAGVAVSQVLARHVGPGDKARSDGEASEDEDPGGGLRIYPEPIALPPLDPATKLFELATRAELSPIETDVMRIATAAELDSQIDRELRALSGSAQNLGIGIDSLLTILDHLGHDVRTALLAFAEEGALRSKGLVQFVGPEGPMPLLARRITVPPRILSFLAGTLSTPLLPLVIKEAVPLEGLVYSAGGIERTQRMLESAWAPSKSGQLPWIIGPAGVGKRTLIAALLGKLGAHANRRLLCVDYQEVEGKPLQELIPAWWREVLLLDAVLCVHDVFESSKEPTRKLYSLYQALLHARLPVVFTSTTLPTCSGFEVPPQVVTLTLPDVLDRGRIFLARLPEIPKIEQLAARFRLPPAHITRTATTARQLADLDGRPAELADVTRAVSLHVAQKVSVVGTKIEDRQSWEDLVLPKETLGGIHELINRARHRHKVLEEWGFARKLAKGTGLSALFSGPPGTGKTMVAGLIARELDLELYQIDLSRIVSKYVGETEKNLAQVFDAADWGNVLLLFDEADSLFARRTEVKSSNDRYANLEVNYLLQRMERFEGVSILTTNLEGSIDSAFKRRLTCRISFPMPDVPERELLWRRMIPKEAAVAESIDFAMLANNYEFAGGIIRNAMLRAAYLAAADGNGITMRHIQRAVVLEYRDAGMLTTGGRLL